MTLLSVPQLTRSPEIAPCVELALPVDPDSSALPIRKGWRDRARVKASMNRWSDLSYMLRAEDANCSAAPDWMPVTLLLAMGARDALRLTDAGATQPTVSVTEHLFSHFPADYVPGLLAALGHIDLGLALRGTGPASSVRPEREREFRAHFHRATEILEGIADFVTESAAIAMARCTVLQTAQDAELRVRSEHARLIDLDPTNPMHMRSLGTYLLPRWFGTFDRIDEEARKTMDRTREIWGRGAYTWVWMDALALDPEAAATIDAELFLEGVHDILARADTPREANLLAAFTGITMRPAVREPRGRARDNRARLHKAFHWIMVEHVAALHPAHWSEALHGLSPCDTAMRRLRRSTQPSQESLARFVQALPGHMPDGFALRVLPDAPRPAPVRPRRHSPLAKH